MKKQTLNLRIIKNTRSDCKDSFNIFIPFMQVLVEKLLETNSIK